MLEIEPKGPEINGGPKNKSDNDTDDLLYMHSRCCAAHWDLGANKKTGEYELLCEECGMSAGSSVRRCWLLPSAFIT